MCLSKNISVFSRPLHWIPFLKITNTKTSRLPFQRPEHVTSKDIIVWPPHLRTPRTGSSFSIRRTCSARNYKFKPFETVRMDYRCFFGGGRCEIKHPNGPNENGTRDDSRERGQYLETGSDTRLHEEAAKVFCDTLLHFVSRLPATFSLSR